MFGSNPNGNGASSNFLFHGHSKVSAQNFSPLDYVPWVARPSSLSNISAGSGLSMSVKDKLGFGATIVSPRTKVYIRSSLTGPMFPGCPWSFPSTHGATIRSVLALSPYVPWDLATDRIMSFPDIAYSASVLHMLRTVG